MRAHTVIPIRIAVVIAFVAIAFAGVQRWTAPAHATTVGCATDSTLDGEEKAFLTLINNYRVQNGLQPLVASNTLSRASAWKSYDLGVNHYFAHDDLNRTWVDRIRDCGYGYNTWLGENIAAGVQTAQQAFDIWKNSPGHDANMKGANYTAIGIGRAYVPGSPYGWYWTTDFGGYDDGWVTKTEAPVTLPIATPKLTPPPVPPRKAGSGWWRTPANLRRAGWLQ